MQVVGKMCIFQWKTGHILETGKDRAKVTNIKWRTPFQIRWKPWTTMKAVTHYCG